MNTDQVLLLRNRAIACFAELYWWVERRGMSSANLSDSKNKINDKFSEMPRWAKEYVAGWCACRQAHLEQKLVFFYTIPDGRLVSTHRDRVDFYGALDIDPNEVFDRATHSGHYWVIQQGTEERIVPYFVHEMEHKPVSEKGV